MQRIIRQHKVKTWNNCCSLMDRRSTDVFALSYHFFIWWRSQTH